MLIWISTCKTSGGVCKAEKVIISLCPRRVSVRTSAASVVHSDDKFLKGGTSATAAPHDHRSTAAHSDTWAGYLITVIIIDCVHTR